MRRRDDAVPQPAPTDLERRQEQWVAVGGPAHADRAHPDDPCQFDEPPLAELLPNPDRRPARAPGIAMARRSSERDDRCALVRARMAVAHRLEPLATHVQEEDRSARRRGVGHRRRRGCPAGRARLPQRPTSRPRHPPPRRRPRRLPPALRWPPLRRRRASSRLSRSDDRHSHGSRRRRHDPRRTPKRARDRGHHRHRQAPNSSIRPSPRPATAPRRRPSRRIPSTARPLRSRSTRRRHQHAPYDLPLAQDPSAARCTPRRRSPAVTGPCASDQRPVIHADELDAAAATAKTEKHGIWCTATAASTCRRQSAALPSRLPRTPAATAKPKSRSRLRSPIAIRRTNRACRTSATTSIAGDIGFPGRSHRPRRVPPRRFRMPGSSMLLRLRVERVEGQEDCYPAGMNGGVG